MKSRFFSTAAVLSALLPYAWAQTHTNCNPTKTKGCANDPALGGNATFNFNQTMNTNLWTAVNQGTTAQGINGTSFTIKQSGDSPQIQSNFYILFGRVEAIVQAAKGQGIVSASTLLSDDLDEIDWEFLGGNSTWAKTNYYGKGDNTTSDRGHDYAMPAATDDFHNYTIDWTKDRLQWWLDDKMIRELKYADAANGTRYPQTPMNLRIGAWAGGDESKNSAGVVTWAGGKTDFNQGPFTMTIKTLYVQDYTDNAKEYGWNDMDSSGDWQKVTVIQGKSAALAQIDHPTTKERWNGLSRTAKIAIAAGALGFVVIAIVLLFAYFLKQRRSGRKEHAAYLAEQQKEAAELLEYKSQMQSGRFGYGNRV